MTLLPWFCLTQKVDFGGKTYTIEGVEIDLPMMDAQDVLEVRLAGLVVK